MCFVYCYIEVKEWVEMGTKEYLRSVWNLRFGQLCAVDGVYAFYLEIQEKIVIGDAKILNVDEYIPLQEVYISNFCSIRSS